MRILFVAAEAMEFEGILERGGGGQNASVASDWARRCRIGGHEALLLANGAGRKRAAAATDAGIDAFQPDAVVSTGFCGAVDENLEIADIVVGTALMGAVRSLPLAVRCPTASSHGTATVRERTAQGPIASIDRIARTAAEKHALRSSGALAVEMEAAGVAERAQDRHLPFYCVRAVTDLAGETLANDFEAALRSDGHFDTILILKGALRHPSARIPELLRLRRRCRRAARALGDFFAVCGF